MKRNKLRSKLISVMLSLCLFCSLMSGIGTVSAAEADPLSLLPEETLLSEEADFPEESIASLPSEEETEEAEPQEADPAAVPEDDAEEADSEEPADEPGTYPEDPEPEAGAEPEETPLSEAADAEEKTAAAAEQEAEPETAQAAALPPVDTDGERDIPAPKLAPALPLRVTREGDVSEKTDITVTVFVIQNSEGETQTSIITNFWYQLKLAWDASAYGNTLHAGDYFNIVLPDEMRFPTNSSATNFDIYDPNGAVVAKAVVHSNGASGGGYITVTFTDYVEDRYNVKGTVYLGVMAIKSKVHLNEINTVYVSIAGTVFPLEIEITGSVDTPTNPEQVITKWASTGSSTDEYVQWVSNINFAKKTLQNAVITDTLTSADGDLTGYYYLPDSFVLTEVTFDEYSNIIATGQVWDSAALGDRLQFSEDGATFTLDMGDMEGQSYRLMYRSTNKPGARLANRIQLIADPYSWVSVAYYVNPYSGGTGSGDLNGRIRITKVDASDHEIRLAGAVFRITSLADGSVFELTTDGNGEATSEKLIAGEYEILEITPPVGYILNDETLPVTVESGSPTCVTVENTLETISIPVAKAWIGPEGTQAVIRLLQDDEVYRETVLNGESGWDFTFEDLPKYDPADGHAYAYRIEEEPMENYEPSYSGSIETGVIVTNRNTETISIPVTKTWIGPEGTQAVIRLLQDDEVYRETVLNGETGWDFTFEDLPKYDPADGHTYDYRIEEEPMENYEPSYSGSAEEGFAVVNTNTEKISILVTKQWIGQKTEQVVIRLLADGVPVREITLTRNENWMHSFRELPRYDSADGHEILYTVEEVSIEGYVTEISGSAAEGFTVTNEITGTVSVSVTKKWIGEAAESVTVRLWADGTEITQCVLNAENGWHHTFTDLPKYKSGTEISYTLTEDPVPGYTAEITQNPDGSFTVINTKEPPPTPPTPPKPPETPAPKTGDSSHLGFYTGILLLSSVLLLWMSLKKRRTRKG